MSLNSQLSSDEEGFTLIELSIVLVIIGLIVGGVLVGQDLIKAAKDRSVISQVQKIDTAINTFKLKYNGLPGDLKNATTFWGTDAGCWNTPTNTVKKEETCNGNGDKRIGDSNTTGLTNSFLRYEWYRAWQQLANAGLIEGSYTGVTGAKGTYDHIGEQNAPTVSGYGSNSAIMMFYYADSVGGVGTYPHAAGHWLWIGNSITASTGMPVDFPINAAHSHQL